MVANIVLMVACLTLIFSGPLGTAPRDYAPYVAIGLVLWQFIQASLNEGCQVFVTAGETIRNTPMPLSVHVLRLVWRHLVSLGHHAVVIPVLLLLFGIAPSAFAWSVLPALALLILFTFSASLLLGLIGARFRDVGPAVANLMQLMFFVTPIFWLPGTLSPSMAWIVVLNPIFAFIDIVRTPLLGGEPLASSWPIALAAFFAVASAAFLTLARVRSRVAYWV